MTCRYLKFNHGSEIPTHIIVFYASVQAASIPGKISLLSVKLDRFAAEEWRRRDGAWYQMCRFHSDDPAKLWDFVGAVTQRKKPPWLFGSGVGVALEVLKFWELVENGTVELWPKPGQEKQQRWKRWRPILMIDRLPTYLRVQFNGVPLKIVDVQNYAAMTWEEGYLDQLADAGPIPLGPHVAGHVAADPVENCRVVGEHIRELMDRWQALNLGTWQATPASLAMCAYRHWLTQEKKRAAERTRKHFTAITSRAPRSRVVIHDDKEAKRLERRAYFGGEAQAFRIGPIDEMVYEVDVCAAYPWAASSRPMPYALHKRFDQVNPAWLLSMLDCYGAIAEVQIAGPWTEYPCRYLPTDGKGYRIINVDRDGLASWAEERVIYPEGIYRTVLCGDELHDALEAGHVAQVFGGSLYRMGDIFSGFFQEWFERRHLPDGQADPVMNDLSKMVSNSLIGKLGQMAQTWVPVPWVSGQKPWGTYLAVDLSTRKLATFRSLAWHVERRGKREELDSTAVFIPAFVCSALRHRMRCLRRSLPADSVIIQDTDGLIVTRAAKAILERGKGLLGSGMGDLRYAGEFPSCNVLGPKHYRIGEKWVLAGIHRGADVMPSGLFTQVTVEVLRARMTGWPHGLAIAQETHGEVKPSDLGRFRLAKGRTAPLLLGLE